MVRKARITDIKPIHRLLQYYADKGELLPRPLSSLYDHMRDFSVYVEVTQDRPVACCALQFCWEDLAEIRSLAVESAFTAQGIGSALTQNALKEAASFGIQKVFTLTYRPTFFHRFGFKIIDRSELPLKIWGDCLMCVKFPDCDEIAMIKEI